MGEENKAQSELFESKTLIDFLYIDNERIDSLISQLNHGTLRSVVKTMGTSEGSSASGGVNAPISGKIEHSNLSNETASEIYDPYHSKVLQLLSRAEFCTNLRLMVGADYFSVVVGRVA